MNGMLHISSDELWFGFGNTIISLKLLLSVQQKEQTESKTKQQQVGVTAEETIQCITLIHHNEQKFLWAAEMTVIGVWMVEGEEVRRVGMIGFGDGDGKRRGEGEKEREKERGVIQNMTQIGSEVCCWLVVVVTVSHSLLTMFLLL